MALTVLGATLALAVGAGAGEQDRALAAAKPRLMMTSFSADRTIRPGRTSAVSVSCRRGFALLGSRFQPISVNPANATPVFETVAIVPQPKGASFTFRNTGTATIQIRVIADCTRISGRRSLRTYVASRAFRLRPRASAAAGAQASARKRLGVVCARRNSIPADIGFEARRNDLVRMGWFRTRRGRFGVRGVFYGNRPEKVKLHLSCVQGRGVRAVARMPGGRSRTRKSSLAPPPAESSARRPKIVVRYYTTETQPLQGAPLGDLFTEVDRRARVPWGSPMPSVIPVTDFLTGRGFLDSRQALGSTTVPLGAAAPEKDGRSFFSRLPQDLRDPFSFALRGSELAATFALLVTDQREFDRLLSQLDHSDSDPGETFLSKVLGPFKNLPDCSPGFFIDVYIPADAQEPITSKLLDDTSPCGSTKVEVEQFDAGELPPGTPDGETRWKDHKTERLNISGDPGPAGPFRIEVTWLGP